MVCTVEAAVMELRMYCQRCYVRYVLRTVSTSAAQRATYTCVFYSRTCDMYSRSSVAAVMVLRMYCRRCYVRYVLLTVSTAAAAVVLPSYAATLWVVGHRITIYVLPEFLQTKQYHSCRQLSRLRNPHPYSPPSPLLASPSSTC